MDLSVLSAKWEQIKEYPIHGTIGMVPSTTFTDVPYKI